jgi:hypothetical protein
MNPEDPPSSSGWYRTPTPPTANQSPHPTIPHADLHWSFCNNDSCSIHLKSKFQNNHFPAVAQAIAARMKKSCGCGQPHDPELDWVIRHQKMNPQKACRAWQKGKRVCNVCRFLVNKDGHEERCGTKGWKPPIETETPIATYKREPETETETPVSTKNKENEPPCPREPESEDTVTHTICHQLLVIMMTGPPDHERLAINLSFYQTVDGPEQRLPTLDSRPTNGSIFTPCSDPPDPPASGHQQDQIPPPASGHQQDQIPPHILEDITHVVPHRRRRGRQYRGRSPIRKSALGPAFGLAGVSAWRGGLMSQRSRDMLLASAATTASIWVVTITLATCYAMMK